MFSQIDILKAKPKDLSSSSGKAATEGGNVKSGST